MDPPPDCSSCYMKHEDVKPATKKEDEGLSSRRKTGVVQESAATNNLSDVTKSFTPRLINVTDQAQTVRSSAVVTYSATKRNAVLSPPALSTNLNLAPSNWLRKTIGLRPENSLSGGNCAGSNGAFNGFAMAKSNLDHVGKVDIISDAENIKKLLKIPYSKAHVSMAIHRIGRTILLENFDIKKYAAEESEWKWFRNFFKNSVQHGGNTLLKKKRPSSQYERLMLSKFLYHSTSHEDHKEEEEVAGKEEYCDAKLVEIDDKDANPRIPQVLGPDPSFLFQQDYVCDNDASILGNGTGAVVGSEKRWRYWTPNDTQSTPELNQSFERNILWTFEDLQMMLGTNMPIFGGGVYPAVSLRLRDSEKPINVLTGIDYWLDNLICNVPELLMCFHVNGIVQKYEKIKTEEIPHLEHSSFHPQVIKDIAQNILSFLKSNCTKEGHTYWLFKGSEDDVVKLYDLTTLCAKPPVDKDVSVEGNPYIYSVAMLLYKTAINLMQSKDTCDHHVTVKKLLGQCIELLDPDKHRYEVSSSLCMLSTLFLPDFEFTLPLSPETSPPAKVPGCADDGCETCTAHHDADIKGSAAKETAASNAEEVASIRCVKDLSKPQKMSKEMVMSPSSRGKKKPYSMKAFEQASGTDENCHKSLVHVANGLKILKKDKNWQSWQKGLFQQLTRNAALAYFRLAQQANKSQKQGRALRCIRLALESYETYDFFLKSNRSTELIESGAIDQHDCNRFLPPDFHLFLPRVLSLCGEVHFSTVDIIKAMGNIGVVNQEEFSSLSQEDKDIRNCLQNIVAVGQYTHLTQFSSEIHRALEICHNCYYVALTCMGVTDEEMKSSGAMDAQSAGKEARRKMKRFSDKHSPSAPKKAGLESQSETFETLKTTLIRRLGHASNELGASALNEAVVLLNSSEKWDGPTAKEQDVWNKAVSHFETAYQLFAKVTDTINQALVLSNMGRSMRVHAQFYAGSDGGPVSQQERYYFQRAIENYNKALTLLGPREKRCPTGGEFGALCSEVYDNIAWEISSSYYTMAQTLQDYAPLDQYASEKAEKEVVDFLTKSLKHCQDIWLGKPKKTLALYRQAEIHHRKASLHHNSYRHCSDGHKCKQLRNLAEKHYNKAIEILEGLDHPNDLLRFQLELISMKEHHASFVRTGKAKLLLDCLSLLAKCSRPLQQIQKSLQVKIFSLTVESIEIARKESVSPHLETKHSSSSEVDNAGIAECTRLTGILATIAQSSLLSLVKATSNTFTLGSSPSAKAHHQLYKDMYSRALRELQPLKSKEEPNISPPDGSIEDNAKRKLDHWVSLAIKFLEEIKNSLDLPR